jgi:branched-chain amino acid transport system ATP-binding protein
LEEGTVSGLEVRDLCKSFSGLRVAQQINFDLQPGARKALIGPNGAGKSTFANLITGILAPTSGEIRFNGRDIGRVPEAGRVKLGIAKTFQITTLFRQLTVLENIFLPLVERDGYGARWFGRVHANRRLHQEADELLAAFDLNHLADRPVETLAYGQQRLVEIALTLALKPKVLILDEPAAGVPSSESHLIHDAIERLPGDLAVLIIEHDMDLVFRVANHIVVLVAGAILVEGTPDDISRDPRVREVYLGGEHG